MPHMYQKPTNQLNGITLRSGAGAGLSSAGCTFEQKCTQRVSTEVSTRIQPDYYPITTTQLLAAPLIGQIAECRVPLCEDSMGLHDCNHVTSQNGPWGLASRHCSWTKSGAMPWTEAWDEGDGGTGPCGLLGGGGDHPEVARSVAAMLLVGCSA